MSARVKTLAQRGPQKKRRRLGPATPRRQYANLSTSRDEFRRFNDLPLSAKKQRKVATHLWDGLLEEQKRQYAVAVADEAKRAERRRARGVA